MDFDGQKMNELLEITRENNKILRSMRRTQRWSSFFAFMYWMIILGSIFGTYYYFQPAIQKYTKTFQTSVGILEKFQNTAASIPTDLQTAKNWIGR
jgi:membrane protein required for beta-lactamase induction